MLLMAALLPYTRVSVVIPEAFAKEEDSCEKLSEGLQFKNETMHFATQHNDM
jgi:hypothetical protein